MYSQKNKIISHWFIYKNCIWLFINQNRSNCYCGAYYWTI